MFIRLFLPVRLRCINEARCRNRSASSKTAPRSASFMLLRLLDGSDQMVETISSSSRAALVSTGVVKLGVERNAALADCALAAESGEITDGAFGGETGTNGDNGGLLVTLLRCLVECVPSRPVGPLSMDLDRVLCDGPTVLDTVAREDLVASPLFGTVGPSVGGSPFLLGVDGCRGIDMDSWSCCAASPTMERLLFGEDKD